MLNHFSLQSLLLVEKSTATVDIGEKWTIKVDEESSLVTFKLKTGGTLCVKNEKLELLQHVDKSCEWMIKEVDNEHFKIFNANGMNHF
jgi:hypothetical protein